mgnify:CR=1 FL=1
MNEKKFYRTPIKEKKGAIGYDEDVCYFLVLPEFGVINP